MKKDNYELFEYASAFVITKLYNCDLFYFTFLIIQETTQHF